MMEAEQPSLFDRVRLSDPDTSWAAAASLSPAVLGAQQAAVLREIGPDGATAFELAIRLGPEFQQSVVARRLTDLRDLGLVRDSGVRRPGRTGRQLIVWNLTRKEMP